MRAFVEIASLLIGVTLVSLLVHNPSGSAQVIGAASSGFGSLLSQASGQGMSYGNFPAFGG
jgi:hypothetical protein